MRRLWLIIGLLLLTSCAPREADFKSRVPISDRPIENEVSVLSEPQLDPHRSLNGASTGAFIGKDLPSEINLNVPFFSQAPDANWDAPWQEACEESAVVLAVHYAIGKPLSKELFKSEVLRLVEWENQAFGGYEHTAVDQTARMMREALGFSDFEIFENPSIGQLKSALAKGSVVVAPFSGKDLKTPFYSNGGPVYHMMVLRGYDSKNFITNDVGTKRGENFIYPYARIMETLHDWHESDIRLGAKKVIVLNQASN